MDVAAIEIEGENHVEKSRKKAPMLGSQQFPINFKNLLVPIQILEKSSFSLYLVLLGLKKMTC
jgi:hypothetical protein